MNNKEVKSVQYEDLEVGDVVFFRPPLETKLPFARRMIGYVQALVNQRGGHFDSDHVGIIESKTNVGGKTIVHICHITARGFRREKFEPTKNPNHALAIIMRADDEKVRRNIGQSIRKIYNEQGREFNWTFSAAVKSFYHSLRKSTPKAIEEEKIKLNTICSKLVIQAVKKATVNDPDFQPTINSNSLPKVLEANLYHNKNYKVLSFTGPHNAYSYINYIIKEQIHRLKNSKNPEAAAKGQVLESLHEKITKELTWKKMGDIEKAIQLLQGVNPILSLNTGRSLIKSTAHTAIMNAASHFGIYERDIKKNNNPTKTAPPYPRKK